MAKAMSQVVHRCYNPRIQDLQVCGTRRPAYDARGIFLCYVCPKCEARKLARFRPEVLTDSNYETTEAIDED